MRDETPETATERQQRERRERIFGEVLPESTQDDTDDRPDEHADDDAWLRSQVPPHHG
jgi:hypothetical protein